MPHDCLRILRDYLYLYFSSINFLFELSIR